MISSQKRDKMPVQFLYENGPNGLLRLGKLNLGDLLCSPKTYFSFYSDQNVLVIGGGIQTGFATANQLVPER